MKPGRSRAGHGSSDSEPLLATQKRVVDLCALVAFFDGLDTQAIAFVAPVLSMQWGIEPKSLGPVFSAGLVGLALGALLFGPLADRFGRKAVILFCVAVFGASSLATTLASNIPELAMWRVVTGLGLGGVLPNLISLTNENAPPRFRNALVMIMFCGFPFGATVGGLITTPLVDAAGWKGIFYLGGTLPLALLPALWLGLPNRAPTEPAANNVEKGQIRQLFREGRMVPTFLIWLTFFSNLLVMYLLVNWLPSLLSLIGTSLSIATLSTALLNLGGILGALVLSWLISRLDTLLLLGTAYISGALALAVISLASDSVPLLLAASAYAGSVIVGGQIAMNAVTASYYPLSIKSTGVGWALGIGRLGSIIGPLLGGWLLGMGWQGMSVVKATIAPTLIAALAVFALRRILKRQKA